MSSSTICPGCNVRLVIRPTHRYSTIVCPRCLTAAPNPEAPRAQVCPRCQRGNMYNARQCAFCAMAFTPGAARDDRVCVVCAESGPGHAANCPYAPRRQADPPPRPAVEDAHADAAATGWFGSIAMVLLAIGAIAAAGPAGLIFVVFVAVLASAGGGGSGGCLKVIGTLLVGAAGLGLLVVLVIWIQCSGRRYPSRRIKTPSPNISSAKNCGMLKLSV